MAIANKGPGSRGQHFVTGIGVVLFVLAAVLLVYATTVVHPGRQQKSLAVDCDGVRGRITVNDSVHYREGEANYRNGVSIRYAGTQRTNCCWMQFIWREVLVYRTPASGSGSPASAPKSGTIRTTGGSYDLTTDASRPNYNTDSASRTNPCYDAQFSHITDGDSLTIYDRPGSALTLAFGDTTDARVTRIESKAHFDSYLVCNGSVCAKVTWVSTYTWVRGSGVSGPTYEIEDPVSPSSLNRRQREKLDEQYPRQTVLR